MAATRGDQVTFEWAGQVDEGGAPRAEAASAAEPGSGQARTKPAAKAPGTPARLAPGRARPKVARMSASPRGEPAGPSALPPDDELWDVHAAARFLKRSVSWVYHRAEDGSLPVKRLAGWGLRFIPGELRAWVESGGVVPARRRE